ncbi:DUF4136 domain-containing protein [Pyxidicoccus sp. 3LFB2]
MRLTRRLAPPLLALWLAACTGIDVHTQQDGNAARAASSYRTYAWMPRPSGAAPAQAGDAVSHVEKSVDEVLTARGYRRAEAGATPDFLIKWGGAIRDLSSQEVVEDMPTPRGRYRNPYGDTYQPPIRRTYVREFSKGELDLDVVDASSGKLVWRGTAKGNLDKDSSAAEEQAWLKEAVSKLLAEFPPQPAKN